MHVSVCVGGEMLCEIIPLPMSRVALVEDKRKRLQKWDVVKL